MPTSFPPLNSLRAFEVAARRGSFVRAAEELFVTPAAISHQVKQLEEHLGMALFFRQHRGLELTEAGRQLLPELTRGFGHMERGIGSLVAEGLTGSLSVLVMPSFATLWLIPRLGRFLDNYPEIEISINAKWQDPNAIGTTADIAIFYGLGNYPGLVTQLLMREEIFPVCAPGLLNNKPLRKFQDLRNHTLLHDVETNADEPTLTWRRWLRDAGIQDVDPNRGVKFSNSILLTEAAANGQGIALGRTTLVEDYLLKGRLIRPLHDARPADYAYHIVTSQAGSKKPRVQAFINWLESEVDV